MNVYLFFLERRKERRKVFRPKVHRNFGGTHGYLGKKSKKYFKKFPYFLESFTIRNLFYYSLKKWGQCHGQRGGQCLQKVSRFFITYL
jgi:hypothetical protein